MTFDLKPNFSCLLIARTLIHDYLQVVVEGPMQSPFQGVVSRTGTPFLPRLMPFYQGGFFKLELFLPAEYPMCPPKVLFIAKLRTYPLLNCCAGPFPN